MAEKKLTESKHCHGPVTLRFSGEPPRFWDEPMLVLVLFNHMDLAGPQGSEGTFSICGRCVLDKGIHSKDVYKAPPIALTLSRALASPMLEGEDRC